MNIALVVKFFKKRESLLIAVNKGQWRGFNPRSGSPCASAKIKEPNNDSIRDNKII